LARSGKVG